MEKNFEQKIYFRLLKMRSIFLQKGNPICSIELGQRLLKSFSQLHVKNSRFFLSYFLKKDDWPEAYAGPRLPTLPYRVSPQSNYFWYFDPSYSVWRSVLPQGPLLLPLLYIKCIIKLPNVYQKLQKRLFKLAINSLLINKIEIHSFTK